MNRSYNKICIFPYFKWQGCVIFVNNYLFRVESYENFVNPWIERVTTRTRGNISHGDIQTYRQTDTGRQTDAGRMTADPASSDLIAFNS